MTTDERPLLLDDHIDLSSPLSLGWAHSSIVMTKAYDRQFAANKPKVPRQSGSLID